MNLANRIFRFLDFHEAGHVSMSQIVALLSCLHQDSLVRRRAAGTSNVHWDILFGIADSDGNGRRDRHGKFRAMLCTTAITSIIEGGVYILAGDVLSACGPVI